MNGGWNFFYLEKIINIRGTPGENQRRERDGGEEQVVRGSLMIRLNLQLIRERKKYPNGV